MEEKGFLLNTDTLAGEAVIKGRVIGKLVAQGTLEIHSSAFIKGQFTAGRLVIPAGNYFHWPDPVRVGSVELAGELVADLQVSGTVYLKSTARLFGNVQAANLVVEANAIFVGAAKIGSNIPGDTIGKEAPPVTATPRLPARDPGTSKPSGRRSPHSPSAP